MKKRFDFYNELAKTLLIVGTIFIILYNFINYSIDFRNYNISLAFFGLISIFIAIIIAVVNELMYGEFNTENIIKSHNASYRYYDKIGIGLLTGGIVTLFTGESPYQSLGLILAGWFFMFFSEKKRQNLEKIEEELNK